MKGNTMSNAAIKRRLAELAAHRAAHHGKPVEQCAPATVTKTAVSIVRTGKYLKKRVGWVKPNGEHGGCTVRVREVRISVSTREVSRRGVQTVELTSGIGARPGYRWYSSDLTNAAPQPH